MNFDLAFFAILVYGHFGIIHFKTLNFYAFDNLDKLIHHNQGLETFVFCSKSSCPLGAIISRTDHFDPFFLQKNWKTTWEQTLTRQGAYLSEK